MHRTHRIRRKFLRAFRVSPVPVLFAKYHFIGSLDREASTPPGKCFQLSTTGIVDGTVILMHEWPKVTLEKLPGVIAELKKQGVEFVTFSEPAAALPPSNKL